MTSSRLSGLPIAAFAAILAVLFLAPSAQAQECSDVCKPWSSCDDYCEICIEETIDLGCARWWSTTCGDIGQCGGCGVSSTRTVTTRTKYGPQDGGATYCIGRRYWYGTTNWSQYQRYTTEVCTITYETITCANGTSTEREASRVCDYGECYQFTNGDCQTGDTVLDFDIHGRECYF